MKQYDAAQTITHILGDEAKFGKYIEQQEESKRRAQA
jgi:hypothetical protein